MRPLTLIPDNHTGAHSPGMQNLLEIRGFLFNGERITTCRPSSGQPVVERREALLVGLTREHLRPCETFGCKLGSQFAVFI